MDVHQPELALSELTAADLPFLLELWQKPEVMHYADEFPRLRGWSKNDGPERVWRLYQEHHAELGSEHTQLIVWLGSLRIGESFFSPLREGYTFGRWKKPDGVRCVMGDIKLDSMHWRQGLGTQGMRCVVEWVFGHTSCGMFVVPPHRHNPAAERVYEKAGFLRFTGTRSWRNHRIMELTRKRFEELYGQ